MKPTKKIPSRIVFRKLATYVSKIRPNNNARGLDKASPTDVNKLKLVHIKGELILQRDPNDLLKFLSWFRTITVFCIRFPNNIGIKEETTQVYTI
jgi:hypothetical protein